MKNNKSGKILNVLLGIIAFFAIVVIVFWLISKNNNTTNNVSEFKDNLTKMQETAKKYFEDKLPDSIGDTTIIYLDELIEKDILKEMKYGKTKCDGDLSYISATRSADNEYKVKSNLVCGNTSDNIIEKISIKSVIKDDNGKTTEVDNSSNNYKDNIKSSCDCTSTTTCTIYEIPTVCTIKYTYEHVKQTITCPTGYRLNGNVCEKETGDYRQANESYSEEQVKVVDAKKNDGGYHKVYTDYIVTGGVSTKYCEKGTLQGDYCYEYTQKITNTKDYCPTGYVKEGNKCRKYTDIISTSEGYCPAGYEKKNNACYKYTDIITDTEKTCPSGYTLEGNTCYKYTDPIPSTSGKTCPSGYTLSGNTCYKTTSPNKVYGSWGNPVSEYSTKTYEAPYTTDTEKKVLMGKNTIAGITTYNYAIYRRTVSYSCSSGTLQNGKCYHYTSPSGGNTTYSCPSGYTQSGNTCYKTTSPSTSSNRYCPYGYTQSGNVCYKKTELRYNTEKYCPSGYIQEGNTCYKETDLITDSKSYCPTGYTELGDKCYKTTPAKTSTTEKVYSCPTGYTKEGNKENTKCYKLVKSADEYYCENEKATLKGTLCYYKEESKFLGYYCPYGYTLDGQTCYKTTKETTSPIWSNAEYIYSENEYEPGYVRTGKATYVRTCVRDDGRSNPDQDPNTMK